MNREQEVPDFYRAYRAARSFSPAIREITSGMGLHSASPVQKYIALLMEQGYLKRTDGMARTLVPVEK